MFPIFILAIILSTGSVSLAISAKRSWRAGGFASAGIGFTPLAVAAATAFYILCIPVLGYFSTTFLFLWIGFMIGHRGHSGSLRSGPVVITACAAAGVTAMIFALFVLALKLNFPDGLLV